jgi:chitodextrinase
MPITRLIPDRRLATALGVMVAAVSVSAASAGTTQQTLVSPAADSYVSSAKPQANYGLKSALKAERSPTMRGYLRFDVPSLPGDVTRATLRIFSSSGSNVGYDVRAVGDNSWGESTITYANAPSPSVATTASSGAYRSGTWTSLDVTPLVSGPGTVSFALTSKSTRALSVASRETGSTSPSLVVETAGPTVPSDTTPPTAPAGLAATSATASSVSVSWNASTDDVGVAGYTVYLDDKEFDVTPPTSRSYTLTGLACGASHVFAVDAYDAAGNYSARASVTTTTTPCVSDTTPPTTPTGLATTATTASSVSVSWAASTDDVGVTGYRVYRAGTLLGSTTQTGYTAGNLSCGVSYTLAVEAYDAAGNVSPKSSVTVFTSACTDTTPPTVLGLPTIAAATQTSITLSWTASLDNVGVAGYGVYLNGTLVGTTPLTTYAFVGLSCGTSYVLGVDAFDATGNRSTKTSVTAAASPCADTSPPTAPSNLQVTASTATSVSSSWTASTDNVGVSGYSLYVNGAKVGTATGTSYVFSSLSCGAGYTLSVEAFDTSGNVSGRTSLATATSACQAQTGSQIRWRFAYSNRSDQNLATSYGYNLIDVSTKSEADATPPGTQGQLWLYDYDNTTCTWEKDDTYITNMVSSTANDPKVAGYYFSNEPDPFACPNAPQQHKARNALIKSLAPTKYTLVGIDANWRSHFDAYGAIWVGTADYVNYNPYICYVGRSTCDFVWLDHVLQVAESLPQPYFVALQAFKEGTEWRWPTASEETQMLQKLCGTKAQGYLTFSWNWQNDPLLNHPDVLDAIKQFTVNGCGSPASDSTPPSSPSGLSGSPTTSSIALSWQASTDNVGVAGYDLYRDGAKVGNTTVPSYTFGGLSCGRGYTLGVEAYDATGNRSPRASLTTSTNTCSGGGGSADPVIAAAGDLCGSPTDCAPTASLLGQIDPDRVLTLGDNAYEDGTTSEYTDYYDPNWGKYKSKTSPAPGNHDYHTSGGAGYFGYFGAQAPAPYYSFDLGSWHLVSLNGEVSHSAGSAQETWLKSDLAAHSGQCVLAYWHEPRFSSGSEHGSDMSFDAVWRDLYAAGADIVLNGHEHDYERFAAQSPTGAADGKGIREFVVGTGGAGLYPFGTPLPNSEVRNSDTFGVLRLTLHPTGYDWRFVPVAGSSFSDSGSGSCN